MTFNNVEDCYNEIKYYCDGEITGYPLLVDVENYSVLQEMIDRFSADPNKTCLYISDFMQKDEVPQLFVAVNKISRQGCFVLIGTSQALMFRDEAEIVNNIAELSHKDVYGHAIILMTNCKSYFEKFIEKDPRLNNNMIIVNQGIKSPLPQITIVSCKDIPDVNPTKLFNCFKDLLRYMERMKDNPNGLAEQLYVKTKLTLAHFDNSIYSITNGENAYNKLLIKYLEITHFKEGDGTNDFWTKLWSDLKGYNCISAYLLEVFDVKGSDYIEEYFNAIESDDEYRAWALWLGIKLYCTNNSYVNFCFKFADITYLNFEYHVYLALADAMHNDSSFDYLYAERKDILKHTHILKNAYIDEFCAKIRKYEKNGVYYLTDLTDSEKNSLFSFLDKYEYGRDEVINILQSHFTDLYAYIKEFTFNEINTTLSPTESNLRDSLTSYFQGYKFQKLGNFISDDFLNLVNQYAEDRPFFKLQSRSSLLQNISKKNTVFYFFDALGVEYLSYIEDRCLKYGLECEIAIGRCELPSITCMNKEFVELYEIGDKKISNLDNLKHHDDSFTYSYSKLPTYLFKELEIIDRQIASIQSFLSNNKETERAVIISDHGASRLAVIYEQEVDENKIQLEEKGVHSGRCCPCEKNPNMPHISYEHGYAVLADYRRFKGGRKANVEVHGGASLEETVIPIITLIRKKGDVSYNFIDSDLTYRVGQSLSLVLFSTEPMEQPFLLICGKLYKGILRESDNCFAEFDLGQDFKEAGKYEATIFEGKVNTNKTCNFNIKKATSTRDLFS